MITLQAIQVFLFILFLMTIAVILPILFSRLSNDLNNTKELHDKALEEMFRLRKIIDELDEGIINMSIEMDENGYEPTDISSENGVEFKKRHFKKFQEILGRVNRP